MLCCKKETSSLEVEDKGIDLEEIPLEEIIHHSKICEFDIKEWRMELRENIVYMDEVNVKKKEETMKEREEREEIHRQEREREIEERAQAIETERRSTGVCLLLSSNCCY